jgi:hypothetical protein
MLELAVVHRAKKAEIKRRRKRDRVRQSFIDDLFPTRVLCKLSQRQKESKVEYIIFVGKVLLEMHDRFGWGSLVEPGLRIPTSA